LPWATIAAALLIAIAGGYWLADRRMSAAELILKAIDREIAAGQPRPPIRVTTRSGSIVRQAVWHQDAGPAATAAGRQRVEYLRMLFETANYSWDDPLSVRAFSTWRDRLAQRQDRLVQARAADGSAAYELSTSTSSGALIEVRMALRESDLHAVHGRWLFRGNESVEITEVPGAVLNQPTPSPTAQIPLSPAPSIQVKPVEQLITPGDELRVRVALRAIDADLGEPIEVERDPQANTIVVTALGLSAGRRTVLENALSGLGRVQLRFLDPQSMREPSRRLEGGPANQAPPLQSKVEAQFGSRTLAEEFTNGLLQSSESALARAHALRELARHFPPETEAQLISNERTLLDSLRSDHFNVLRTTFRRVLADTRQIVAPSGAAPVVPSRNWHLHAYDLVPAMERIDQILTRLLATGGNGESQSTLLSELGRALSRMEAEIAAAEPAFGKAN
jgi:hypothetical protein